MPSVRVALRARYNVFISDAGLARRGVPAADDETRSTDRTGGQREGARQG